MTNRYPLILDTEDGNKIKELPQGDGLYLFGNSIEEVGNINSVGAINAASITVNGQSVTPATFTQLSDTPSSYENRVSNVLKVNSSGSGLEFTSDISINTVRADLTGSVFSDDSTLLIDGVNGELVGPVRDLSILGETGNTPANTGSVDSWLEVTINGNTRYIPLYA